MSTRSNNQASNILLAATEVIAQRGAGKLTIESVARQAGMSKGGVLYHFPTKDALLEGMLSALLSKIDDRREHGSDKSVLSALLGSLDFSDQSERNMSLAILAASAERPELLKPAKAYFQQVTRDVARESKDPDLAKILMLALEGLRFMHMLDLVPWSSNQTKSLMKRMLLIAAEESS
tara:strand:- start:4069 stop:4602 length:534 start_codon:yes stop_codon:yes gene_type:complete